MELFLEYLKAFVVGGAICAIGQVLIDLSLIHIFPNRTRFRLYKEVVSK